MPTDASQGEGNKRGLLLIWTRHRLEQEKQRLYQYARSSEACRPGGWYQQQIDRMIELQKEVVAVCERYHQDAEKSVVNNPTGRGSSDA